MNQSSNGNADPAAKLSQRQLQCLELVSQGLTSKEIGRTVGLSPSTVDNHVRAAVERLGAKNRLDAVRFLLAQAESGEDEQTLIRDDADSPDWWTLPPLGGKPNTLSRNQRLQSMLLIALLAVAVSAAVILTIAGVVKVLD